jgi:DNA polymerase III alpha subunit (gram-positive type)
MNTNTENTDQIPHPMTISGSESRVFFDLETTGLGKNSDITQIAAKVGEAVFQKYVIPRFDIQLEASKVTGITYKYIFFSISQILFSKYLVTFLLQSPSSSEVSL